MTEQSTTQASTFDPDTGLYEMTPHQAQDIVTDALQECLGTGMRPYPGTIEQAAALDAVTDEQDAALYALYNNQDMAPRLVCELLDLYTGATWSEVVRGAMGSRDLAVAVGDPCGERRHSPEARQELGMPEPVEDIGGQG